MKVIIDPYRGGNDTGKLINNQYEKNILLNLSKYMVDKFREVGINTEIVRENDVGLSDDDRNNIINELKDRNDIIIQNRLSDDSDFDIIYPLRNSDSLASLIGRNLSNIGINNNRYYQRRLPTSTNRDYYSVIRNTSPNESIIIEYNDISDYKRIVDNIVKSVSDYINKKNIYVVKKGDSLYQIANKFGTSVNEIKNLNNLSGNNLSIGQVLKIPSIDIDDSKDNDVYIVKKGDSLYQIASKFGTSVNEIKKLNNLSSNNLSIGDKLIIPNNMGEFNDYIIYIVVKGDSLYKIASKYDTSVSEIKRINNLNSNNLSIGQKLKISKPSNNYINYVVKKGDSLYQIANKYNISVSEIKSVNNLSSNNLSIGQELKIPR